MLGAQSSLCAPIVKLSLCIATFNRAHFIADTLDSILSQMEAGIEVVVVDGASSDGTAELMADFCLNHREIVYHREPINSGVDADYDKAVSYATGRYCWLMSDDDLLKPGAIRRILAATDSLPDLIVVNAEVGNADFSVVLEEQLLHFPCDVSFSNSSKDQFLADVGAYLSFIGCVVIAKDKWMTRDRVSYYGTLFIHVGVIFQEPVLDHIAVISEPLIKIRYGNAMWTGRSFEIWMFKWPKLVWSLPQYSDIAKRSVCREYPWRSLKTLFHQRAIGSYSVNEFCNFLELGRHKLTSPIAWLISRFPASVANFIMVLYFLIRAKKARMALYDLLHSRHASWVSFTAARIFGLKHLSD